MGACRVLARRRRSIPPMVCPQRLICSSSTVWHRSCSSSAAPKTRSQLTPRQAQRRPSLAPPGGLQCGPFVQVEVLSGREVRHPCRGDICNSPSWGRQPPRVWCESMAVAMAVCGRVWRDGLRAAQVTLSVTSSQVPEGMADRREAGNTCQRGLALEGKEIGLHFVCFMFGLFVLFVRSFVLALNSLSWTLRCTLTRG